MRTSLFLLFAAAGLAGCADTARQSDRLALDNALADFHASRFAAAEQKLNPATDPSRPLAAQALYLRGMARVRMATTGAKNPDGLLDQARGDFDSALAWATRTGDAELARNCSAASGHIAFNRSPPDYARAARHYREALPAEGRWLVVPDMDDVLFHLAVSEQRAGDWENAGRHFNALLNRWPRGRYEEQARRHVSAQSFSIRAGAFSAYGTAVERQDALRKQGLQARVENRADGAARHVVEVGRYRTYGEAVAAMGTVKAALRPVTKGNESDVVVTP